MAIARSEAARVFQTLKACSLTNHPNIYLGLGSLGSVVAVLKWMYGVGSSRLQACRDKFEELVAARQRQGAKVRSRMH